MTAPGGARVPQCPSAQPGMAGAFVFGVQGQGRDGRSVGYLPARVPPTADLLALAGPVKPTEVFRFGAPCAGTACGHFNGRDCRLASKLVQLTPPASRAIPACALRPDCRWWMQEGVAACRRCPRVVTEAYDYTDAEARAADPAA